MPDLQERHRLISAVLSSLTILTGLAIALLVMAKSRSVLGLPMGNAPLEGIRLKFLTWLVICLVSIPLAFYLSRVSLYGAFGLLMVSVGKFTSSEAKQFALRGSYPSAWLASHARQPLEARRVLESEDRRGSQNERLISGLISDNEEAVAAFGESDNCIVVDWRDGAEEIFEALTPFLPQGYLRVEKLGSTEWTVQAGNRPPRAIEFSKNTKKEEFFVALNEALVPDFELWQYTPVDGDGYSLFLAPTAWWQSLAEKHPRTLAKYFHSTNRLAAYWRKSYLARLLSNP